MRSRSGYASPISRAGLVALSLSSILISFSHARAATGPLFEASYLSAGVNPYSVAFAIRDLNGDGRKDLVVAGSGGYPAFSTYFQSMDGVFLAGSTASTGGGSPTGIAAGDLNQDAYPDIVISDDNGVLRLFFGDGGGWTSSDLPVGSGPNSVTLGDWNADGANDLAVVNLNSNTLSVLLATGQGGFDARTDYPTGSAPLGLVVADFDGDGALDIATANSGSNTGSIYLGDADGVFHPAADVATGAEPRSVAALDLNRDGRVDLAFANRASSTVSILVGQGDGSFAAHTDLPVPAGPASLAAGDVNGDTRLDLVVLNGGPSSSATLLLSGGDGTLVPGGSLHIPGGGFDGGDWPAGRVAITTFDSDSKRDIVILDAGSSAIEIFTGRGHGTFGSSSSWPAGASPADVVVADFDGNGRKDLAVANRNSNSVSVLIGKCCMDFEPRVAYATGPRPHQIAAADLDLDGHPDLVVTQFEGGSVGVLCGRGDGTFDARIDVPVGSSPDAIAIADLDENGVPDLVVSTWGGQVMVLLGNGDRTFDAPVGYAVPDARGMVAGQFDADGHIDVAVASSYPHSNFFVVLRGSGTGTFVTFYYAGMEASAITAADWNQDGILDLALTGPEACGPIDCLSISGGIYTVGNGAGDFTRESGFRFDTGEGPVDLTSADFDGDGLPDVAAASYFGNAVSVALGDGGSGSWPSGGYGTGRHPTSVTASDMNADGRPDLVVTNETDESVSILLARSGVTSAPDVESGSELRLAQSRPNPSAGNIGIEYVVPTATHVRLRVYDISGRTIADLVSRIVPAGEHTARWDRRTLLGTPAPPGIYLYELVAGGQRLTRRLVLVR